MKVYIETPGDRSVGIQPSNLTIDLGNCNSLASPLYRGETRKALQQCFEELLDEAVGVTFEDERPHNEAY
jgi:hypothetical protein